MRIVRMGWLCLCVCVRALLGVLVSPMRFSYRNEAIKYILNIKIKVATAYFVIFDAPSLICIHTF